WSGVGGVDVELLGDLTVGDQLDRVAGLRVHSGLGEVLERGGPVGAVLGVGDGHSVRVEDADVVALVEVCGLGFHRVLLLAVGVPGAYNTCCGGATSGAGPVSAPHRGGQSP